SRRRHTRSKRDWSSDVCSSDLEGLLIIDGDEPLLIEQIQDVQVITCGFSDTNDIKLRDVVIDIEKTIFKIGSNSRFSIALAGSRSEERRVGKECKIRG